MLSINNIFYFLTFLTIFLALMVILAKNPIHSVLYLVMTFISVAGHYLLLNAQFLFVVHIIVYAGAIMVLFLFVIMFLNLNTETEPQRSFLLRLSGLLAGGLLFLVFIAALKGANYGISTVPYTEIGMIKTLGQVLFKDFLLPFELASILFLAAMVGAVMLGKKQDSSTEA
jgi:NADH-quinone oxidoreductase subunit J